MRKKLESAKKILFAYKKFKFRKTIKTNLKILIKRKKIWREFFIR